MAQSSGNTKKKLSIKRYLITGLVAWLPLMVTIWVVTYVVNATDGLVTLIPEAWRPEHVIGFHIPGLGFIITIILLFISGVFAANVIGKTILNFWEQLLTYIPGVKTIYSSVKKVSESLLSDSRQSFKTPVLVQFPREGIWTIGFVSGSNVPDLNESIGEDEEYMSVYVPTTPNPTGGYYIMTKKSETRSLNMSVDEALKYVISLGMVTPDMAETAEELASSESKEIENSVKIEK